jgi:hypothetical protein
VFALRAAVLAGIVVAVKDLIAGHFALAVRPPDHLGEADNGGQLDGICKRVDITEAVFDHFRFALVDEDDGAAGAAYGKGLVALVQDQYRMVQHRNTRLPSHTPNECLQPHFSAIVGTAQQC